MNRLLLLKGLQSLQRIGNSRFPLSLASVILKKEANKCVNVEQFVNLSFNIFTSFPQSTRALVWKGSPWRLVQWSIPAWQIKEEISELLKILAFRKPKFILEIGTADGGTLFLFTRASRPDAVIISIDIPSGYPGSKVSFYKTFGIQKQRIQLVRSDSHARSTLNTVKTLLTSHKLDFLFIDGDHTYDGVKSDFEMYSGLVAKDGLIAFHDIAPFGSPEHVGGVPKFWNEIKQDFQYLELLNEIKQDSAGIGIIFEPMAKESTHSKSRTLSINASEGLWIGSNRSSITN